MTTDQERIERRKRPIAVADKALQQRLKWASMHWGVDLVSYEAWPHLIDAIVAGLDDAGLLATTPIPPTTAPREDTP